MFPVSSVKKDTFDQQEIMEFLNLLHKRYGYDYQIIAWKVSSGFAKNHA
jgi:hypothetical protein